MAELSINHNSIEANLRFIKETADRANMELVLVVKPCQDHAPTLRVFDRQSPTYLGMSKIQIVRKFAGDLATPVLMTNIPAIDTVEDVVRYSAVSLNSEPATLDSLDAAAGIQGKVHGYYLMVDVGDRREGVLPRDVQNLVREIQSRGHLHLRFMGLGANYACAHGVQPSAVNLDLIYSLASEIELAGIPVPRVSLGGSSILEWTGSDLLRRWPTQIRIGQAALLGTVPVSNLPFAGLRTDTLRFKASIVEIISKSGALAELSGTNAIGETRPANDPATRRRAILDFGVVDVDPLALTPRDDGIRILTANSDCTIVDVEASEQDLRVGSPLYFDLKYRSMLQGFVSPYLNKRVVEFL